MHFCLYNIAHGDVTPLLQASVGTYYTLLRQSLIMIMIIGFMYFVIIRYIAYSLLASNCMYLSDRTVMQYRCIMSTGSTYSYVQIGFFSYDTKAGSDLPPSLSFQIWWRTE